VATIVVDGFGVKPSLSFNDAVVACAAAVCNIPGVAV
jgi:hypothetical protein